MLEYMGLLLLLTSISGCRSLFFSFGPTTSAPKSSFTVYWNVPTFMCHKYGMYFKEVSEVFGIRLNDGDKFTGNQVTILYDPGEFPALLEDGKGKITKRNGGLPQDGDLAKHLEAFKNQILKTIPNESFSGLGVIDFERWRPIFRQNWASLDIYRKTTLAETRKRHPFMNEKAITRLATETFNKSGRRFMEETLKLARELRPSAKWGYYAYPYCYNETPNNTGPRCDSQTMADNDGMKWMFGLQDIYVPSLYVRSNMDKDQKIGLAEGRVNEANRLAKKFNQEAKILPYFWYRYQNEKNTFLSKAVAESMVRQIVESGADGIIIWGSSSDLDDQKKCKKLHTYLMDTLGPLMSGVSKRG